MPRPRKCRRIVSEFGTGFFGPKGIPMRELERVNLSHDELEALRLGDLEGLYHEEAAQMMGVSRATFGRILATARQKIANALINGKGILIEGGNYMIADNRPMCRFWKNGGRHGWDRSN